MTDNPLARIPVITQAILAATTLNGHVYAMSEMKQMRYLADKIKATLEVKNDIGEAHVRICRDAGLRFPLEFKRGGDGSNQHCAKEQNVEKKRLADFGFDSTLADICRKIAALPDELFEDLILNIRLGEHKTYTEITVSNFKEMGCIHLGNTRTSAYQTKPQAVEVDVDIEFARHMFDAGEHYGQLPIHFIPAYEMAIRDAIEAYKQTGRQ